MKEFRSFLFVFPKASKHIACSLSIVFLFLHCSLCLAAESELAGRVNALLSKKVLNTARVGIHVVSLNNGKTLYKRNDENLFSIASNTKLFTTAAALVYLGPEYKYKTVVYRGGNVSPEGVLDGDIIIKGSGDPNLSGRFYNNHITAVPESWASKVKGAGISVVNGDIIADDTVFDRNYTPPTWPGNQLSEWYCAEIAGLSFNDNCIDYMIAPGTRVGDLVQISLEPDTAYVKIDNQCKTTNKSSKRSYSIKRRPGTNEIILLGTIPLGSARRKGWITIHNPGLYLATVFKETLEESGIKVRGTARIINSNEYTDAEGLHEIAHTVSTMGQSVEIANTRSQNFYAEQILKTLGANLNGEGSFVSGVAVIQELMLALGYERNQYRMVDGSGLSREDMFSPSMVTSLLAYMYKHKHYNLFRESLAIPGDKKGSLRNRFRDVPYKSRIRAKSGYIARVSVLSGYVETLSDNVLAFSIIVNGFKKGLQNVRDIQDAICEALVECG